jgi:hypothetical protein
MRFFDPNNPNEKKKMIAAAVLGLAAIIVLGYVFFGGSSTKPPTNSTVTSRPSPTPRLGATPLPVEPASEDLTIYQPVVWHPVVPAVSEANRNIFSYYEPPPATPKPVYVPTPTPAPTPPLVASSLTPTTVYAGTPTDFSLQLVGDKFTAGVRIFIDGRELPTRLISAQQLFTTVPAALIANAGTRQVIARSSDGRLYSNMLSLNVTPAPTPNYNYVGIIGKPRFNDTAVLQDKNSKELINVQRGDAIGGRFRVVSISEKEVRLIDTVLKIPHKLTFSNEVSPNTPYRAPGRTIDDEP